MRVVANRLEVERLEGDDEVALRHERRDAADHERHRERRDERVDPEPGRDDAVGDADREPDDDAGRHGERGRSALRRDGRGRDAGERVDRADREVDAAADEHERPGGRDDDRRRLLVEDVHEVRRGAGSSGSRSRAGRTGSTNGMTIPPRRTRLVIAVERPSALDALAARGAHEAATPSRRGLGLRRERGLEDRALVHPCALELGRDAARAHDEHPMGEAEDLLDLARDEQDAHAVGGEAREQVVERLPGADVDAARRLVRDEQPRPHEERPREEQLLLVAARQRARRPLDRASPGPSGRSLATRDARSCAAPHEARRGSSSAGSRR